MTELSPGCRVTCVNDTSDTDFEGHCVEVTPVKDCRYTVAAVFTALQVVSMRYEMCDSVVLRELGNPACACLRGGLMPLGFFAWRFALLESAAMQQLRDVAARVPKGIPVREEV